MVLYLHDSAQCPNVLGAPASLIGLELPALRLRPFALPRPDALSPLTPTPAGLALWGWQTPYRGSTKLRLIR
jgi:hypothetical protein